VAEVLEEQQGRSGKTPERSPGRGANRPAHNRGNERSRTEAPAPAPTPAKPKEAEDAFYLPQIGVEIVETEDRNGVTYHSIRDLRNGRVIKNVTRKGARKLWNYAIQRHEDAPVDPAKVQWNGPIGLVHSETRAGKRRYDLALRENGDVRVFYGVTEDGMEGRWTAFIQEE